MATKKSTHATQSFAQLTAKANQEALKPVVQQMIWDALTPVLKMIEQRLIQDKEMLQIRQLALEAIVSKESAPGEFDKRLAEEIANVQDKSQGLIDVGGTVQVGDKVRFDLSTQKDGVWLESTKMAIEQCNVPNAQGEFQTVKELEEQLVGLEVGVEKEFAVKQGDDSITCKVTVRRVSRKAAV